MVYKACSCQTHGPIDSLPSHSLLCSLQDHPLDLPEDTRLYLVPRSWHRHFCWLGNPHILSSYICQHPTSKQLSLSPSLSLSHTLTHVDLKKCTTWELWVKFYLGQNEGCCPRDSIPGSSEKLLQRSREEGQYTCDFWWGGNTCNQALFFFFFCRRFLLLMRRLITMKEFSAFLDMRRYKSWAHKIGSWKDLTIRRPVLPVFPRAQSTSFVLSHLNSFQGVLKVSSCSNVC